MFPLRNWKKVNLISVLHRTYCYILFICDVSVSIVAYVSFGLLNLLVAYDCKWTPPEDNYR